MIGGNSDLINSSEKFVEQNSGLVIEQIRVSELAAKKIVICYSSRPNSLFVNRAISSLSSYGARSLISTDLAT